MTNFGLKFCNICITFNIVTIICIQTSKSK